MTERPAENWDVLVAGAGMVGAAFAASLAQSPEGGALRIAVIERQPFVPRAGDELFDPRVVALTEASRLLLEDAGIWTGEVAAGACPYRHMEVRDSEGTGLIEFHSADVQRDNLGHFGEPSLLAAVADRQLGALANIELIYGSIAKVAAAEDGSGATLWLDGGASLSAPLLVAADGANSLVREQCGFVLRSWDYGHSAVVATIRTAAVNGATACQWFTPHGPLAFLPLRTAAGDCHYSSIVWSQDHQVADRLMALSDEDFCRALSRASEARFGEVLEVSRRYCHPLRQRHATHYVKPGVALVGDAAHTIHPLAGQGVNLGFADAGALVEEIVRGLGRGLAVGDASTLARYQRRRKPDNLAMMAAMEGFKRLFANGDPVLRVLRNRGMSGLNVLGPVKNQLIRRAMGF